jgi:hypothetical protein
MIRKDISLSPYILIPAIFNGILLLPFLKKVLNISGKMAIGRGKWDRIEGNQNTPIHETDRTKYTIYK